MHHLPGFQSPEADMNRLGDSLVPSDRRVVTKVKEYIGLQVTRPRYSRWLGDLTDML